MRRIALLLADLLLNVCVASNNARLLANAVHFGSVPSPPFRLVACTMLRNEAAYVREWIVYHLLVGVEHFYLYDNDSTDNTAEVLAPFVAKGVVTYRRWPGPATVQVGRKLTRRAVGSISHTTPCA